MLSGVQRGKSPSHLSLPALKVADTFIKRYLGNKITFQQFYSLVMNFRAFKRFFPYN